MLPLHTNCVHSHPSPAEELYNSSMTESQIVPSVRPQSHSCHFPCSLVNFYPQGWNQPGWIILGREFSSAGMKWAGKNHPCGRIFIRRDEMSEEESSLRENFYPQGWNQQGRIIPGGGFLSAGMKSVRMNHPRKRIFIRRDEISADESSLEEIFYPQGWNQHRRGTHILWIALGWDFKSHNF